MHFYIYDNFVNNKRFTSEINQIENRLIDLGINGKIEKLSILKNTKEIIDDALKEGTKTIVIVGDDSTFNKIFKEIADHDAILGFIPVGKTSRYARALGIPQGIKACDVLSRRIIINMDLGKVNGSYFFSALEVPSQAKITFECDNHYKIVPIREVANIKICNFGDILGQDKADPQLLFSPQDGYLNMVFLPGKRRVWDRIKKISQAKDSVFPIKKVKISSSDKHVSTIADGETIYKTPLTVQIVPGKIEIIVGKKRLF